MNTTKTELLEDKIKERMTVEEAIKEFNKEFFRDEIDSVYEALEERLDTISEREDTKYIEILRMKHIIDDVLQTIKDI